jgi:hypothetical protein
MSRLNDFLREQAEHREVRRKLKDDDFELV